MVFRERPRECREDREAIEDLLSVAIATDGLKFRPRAVSIDQVDVVLSGASMRLWESFPLERILAAGNVSGKEGKSQALCEQALGGNIDSDFRRR